MKKNRNGAERDFFRMMGRTMSPASVRRAEAKARKMLLDIRLAELRKSLGVKQSEMKGFAQPDVSRLEARGDLKVSTLVEYCRSLGAEVRITARPAKGASRRREFVLLES